jgi:hypothetical protein
VRIIGPQSGERLVECADHESGTLYRRRHRVDLYALFAERLEYRVKLTLQMESAIYHHIRAVHSRNVAFRRLIQVRIDAGAHQSGDLHVVDAIRKDPYQITGLCCRGDDAKNAVRAYVACALDRR